MNPRYSNYEATTKHTGLSPSQEEGVINVNRCGRRSLSLRNQKKPEVLLEAKSGDEVLEISDSVEE